MSRKTVLIVALLLLVPLLVIAQERVDLNAIHKIKVAELGSGGGFGGGRGPSRVMDIMYNLTDRYGPRLTNSPQFRAAEQWAAGQLKEWGLSNVQLEKWSSDMPGWQCTYFAGSMVEPTYQPLIGMPVAWTGGTNGAVTGEAILAEIQTPADMDKFHGKLNGKIVLNVSGARASLPHHPIGSPVHGCRAGVTGSGDHTHWRRARRPWRIRGQPAADDRAGAAGFPGPHAHLYEG